MSVCYIETRIIYLFIYLSFAYFASVLVYIQTGITIFLYILVCFMSTHIIIIIPSSSVVEASSSVVVVFSGERMCTILVNRLED